MDFREFEKQIVKVKKIKLPGEEVQLRMAPLERASDLKRGQKRFPNAKQAGVMALFYPGKRNETKFILILRKTYNGVHSAQVGFPGGKVEPIDTDLQATALRETQEEVGVPQQEIEVIRSLTEMYIPPSNFIVQPFLGMVSFTPRFIPQEEEVEAIIEVDLTSFMDNKCITTEIITTSYAREWEVPAFKFHQHIVWGATAMILSEVREMLGKIL